MLKMSRGFVARQVIITSFCRSRKFGRSETEEGPRDKRRRPGLAGRLGSGLFDEGI